MPVTFRSASAVTASGASPRTVDKPAGAAENDLLVLVVVGNNAGQAVSAPSGFVVVSGAEITGTTLNIAAYVKTAGGSEPATYDVIFTGSGSITAAMMALYSDTAAVLVTDGADNQSNGSGDRVCPAVTTTIANTLLVCASANGNLGTTPPGGATERWDDGTSPRTWCCTRRFAGPGDTGTTTGTGTSMANNTVTVAVAEASAALDAPTGLTATAVATDQIDLAWQDTNDDETGFHIERSPTGVGDWNSIAINPADDLTYSDTGLDAGTAYYYRVRAYRT